VKILQIFPKGYTYFLIIVLVLSTEKVVTFIISIVISNVSQSDIEFQCMGANIIKSSFQPQSNIFECNQIQYSWKKAHLGKKTVEKVVSSHLKLLFHQKSFSWNYNLLS